VKNVKALWKCPHEEETAFLGQHNSTLSGSGCSSWKTSPKERLQTTFLENLATCRKSLEEAFTILFAVVSPLLQK
jgi:hypothetical protein